MTVNAIPEDAECKIAEVAYTLFSKFAKVFQLRHKRKQQADQYCLSRRGALQNRPANKILYHYQK